MKNRLLALVGALAVALGITLLGGAGTAQASGCMAITVQNSAYSDTYVWVLDNNTGGSYNVQPAAQLAGSTNGPSFFNPTHFFVPENHTVSYRWYGYGGGKQVTPWSAWTAINNPFDSQFIDIQSPRCGGLYERAVYQIIIDDRTR